MRHPDPPQYQLLFVVPSSYRIDFLQKLEHNDEQFARKVVDSYVVLLHEARAASECGSHGGGGQVQGRGCASSIEHVALVVVNQRLTNCKLSGELLLTATTLMHTVSWYVVVSDASYQPKSFARL